MSTARYFGVQANIPFEELKEHQTEYTWAKLNEGWRFYHQSFKERSEILDPNNYQNSPRAPAYVANGYVVLKVMCEGLKEPKELTEKNVVSIHPDFSHYYRRVHPDGSNFRGRSIDSCPDKDAIYAFKAECERGYPNLIASKSLAPQKASTRIAYYAVMTPNISFQELKKASSETTQVLKKTLLESKNKIEGGSLQIVENTLMYAASSPDDWAKPQPIFKELQGEMRKAKSKVCILEAYIEDNKLKHIINIYPQGHYKSKKEYEKEYETQKAIRKKTNGKYEIRIGYQTQEFINASKLTFLLGLNKSTALTTAFKESDMYEKNLLREIFGFFSENPSKVTAKLSESVEKKPESTLPKLK